MSRKSYSLRDFYSDYFVDLIDVWINDSDTGVEFIYVINKLIRTIKYSIEFKCEGCVLLDSNMQHNSIIRGLIYQIFHPTFLHGYVTDIHHTITREERGINHLKYYVKMKKSIVKFLTGFHSRSGAKSPLLIVSKSRIFDKQVIRIIDRLTR